MAFDLSPITAASCTRTSGSVSDCNLCPARSYCLIAGFERSEVQRWNAILQAQTSLGAGASLFETGDAVRAVFTVRAGCIKTFTVDAQGNERVRGFHLAGDIVGLDALTGEHHLSSAVAVSPAQVCRVPRAKLQALLGESPALAQKLVERLSHTLGSTLANCGDYTAEQRLASFLINMEKRLNPLPGAAARLPMGRRDIANFLRLATETVCRVLTRFEKLGMVDVQDRAIRLLNPAALQSLAAGA